MRSVLYVLLVLCMSISLFGAGANSSFNSVDKELDSLKPMKMQQKKVAVSSNDDSQDSQDSQEGSANATNIHPTLYLVVKDDHKNHDFSKFNGYMHIDYGVIFAENFGNDKYGKVYRSLTHRAEQECIKRAQYIQGAHMNTINVVLDYFSYTGRAPALENNGGYGYGSANLHCYVYKN
jgi:hypothetical protein